MTLSVTAVGGTNLSDAIVNKRMFTAIERMP